MGWLVNTAHRVIVGLHPAILEGEETLVGGTALVVGTDDWAIGQTAAGLEERGWQVLRCHEAGEDPFPCNALRPGRKCPLDVGFDVVVTARARAVAAPAPAEFGVVCALRRGAPLVVAGVGHERPFGPWTAIAVRRGGDVVSACRLAVGRVARASALSATPGAVG